MKLLEQTKYYVKKEKFYTAKVIENLQEIENSKVYAEIGYRSLYEYCVKELNYSGAQASVRVNCVKLVRKCPEVKEKLDSGELSPTGASKIQSFFKGHDLKDEEKTEIIEKVSGLSTRGIEDALNERTEKPISKNVTLNDNLLRKMKKLKREYGDVSEIELIEILVEEKLRSIEKERPKRSERGSRNQRYISRKIREYVRDRASNRCEFVSSGGRRCSCRTNLQFDQLRPVGIGGMSTKDNLQLLCFSHNQLKIFNGP